MPALVRNAAKAVPAARDNDPRKKGRRTTRAGERSSATEPLESELLLHGRSSSSAAGVAALLVELAGGSAASLRPVLRALRRRRAAGTPLGTAGDDAAAAAQLWQETRPDAAGHPPASPRQGLATPGVAPGAVLHVKPPMAADAGKVCFVLGGVLSEADCAACLRHCEAIGWHAASLEYGLGSGDMAGESLVNVSLRDSDRSIFYDETLAARIWEKVHSMIPPSAFEPLRAVRVNSCFRCLRYTDAHAGFAKHVDGRSVVNGEISRVTIQLYLNEGFDGGATRLCHADDTEDAVRGVDVVPRRGMALVFDQSILHKGSPVSGGVKYSARTEVMYC